MLLIGAHVICLKKTLPSNGQSTLSVDTRFSIQKMFDDNVGYDEADIDFHFFPLLSDQKDIWLN